MHTVIRTYTGIGAGEVIDFIVANKREVTKVMQAVNGLVSLSVIKTEAGGFTVTVAKNEKASAAITAVAREWVVKHAGHLKAKPPVVTGGKVLVSISEKAAPKPKA
jgi:hypothetical protein